MREFPFELRLCARLEADGELVARQLGTGVHRPAGRIVDVVCVEPGPDFDERTAITDATIPDAAIDADVGPGRARPRRAILPDLPRDRAGDRIDRAVEIGFFERDRRGGREFIRQVARYPADWFGRVRAIENKPDLASPGDLESQLERDVRLALVDEVVLATGSYVTRAHLNRLPEPVGVWRFDGDAIEVVREPTPLPVRDPGIEITAEHPGRTDVRVITPDRKARARRRLAERAYGKGWRPDAFPACANVDARERAGVGGLPYCTFHDRLVDPGVDCGPACPGHTPAEPPDVDPAAERARTSPWDRDPDGYARTQSGLDRFG